MEMHEGKVEEVSIRVLDTTTTTIRLMKVVAITKTPGCRAATIILDTVKSKVTLNIDEPTARAIAAVFD
jgi:metal-sulfur cluster biosynthetic enzyme